MSRQPEEDILENLASNVDALRAHFEWTLAAAASHSGVPSSLIKHIIHRRANPTIVAVLRLANAFGVSVADLVERRIASPDLPAAPPLRATARPVPASAIGARLRAYRMRRGLSAQAFARVTGISRGNLRTLETAELDLAVRMTARIASGFQIAFSELVEMLCSPVLAVAEPASATVSEGSRELLRDGVAAGATMVMEEMVIAEKRSVVRQPLSAGSAAMAYVLTGAVRVDYESCTLTITRGGAALLALDRPLTLRCISGTAARCLLVVRTTVDEGSEEPGE